MNILHRIGAGATGAALAGTALLGGATPAFAETAQKGCRTGELPGLVQGAPGLKPHQAKGVYLWHGSDGYSLRVTEPGTARLVVTGTVTTSGDLSKVKGVALERDDRVSVGSQRHTLTFRFTNYGGVDGVDFAAECSRTVRVSLRIAGAEAAPDQAFLGRRRGHPTSVPFTIERAHDASPAQVH